MGFDTTIYRFEKPNLKNATYVSDLRSFDDAWDERSDSLYYDDILDDESFRSLPRELRSLCEKKELINEDLSVETYTVIRTIEEHVGRNYFDLVDKVHHLLAEKGIALEPGKHQYLPKDIVEVINKAFGFNLPKDANLYFYYSY